MDKSIFSKLKKVSKHDKVLLITHNDLDGAGPAILFSVVLGKENVEIRHCGNGPMSYLIKNAVLNEADNYNKIIATDISVNEIDAEIINTSRNIDKFILIDHHSTAMFLNKYDWAVVESSLIEDSFRADYYKNIDENKPRSSSATSLVYDYLDYIGLTNNINTELREFVHNIATYDTWDWINTFNNKKECYDLNLLFFIYGSTLFDEKFTEHFSKSASKTSFFLDNQQDDFDKINKTLLEVEVAKRSNFLKYVSKNFKVGSIEIGDKKYSMCMWVGNTYMNDVFLLMKEKYPQKDLYIINYGTGIGLRTDTNIDVGQLAKMFRGGGHKEAAGIKISDLSQIKYTQSALHGVIQIDY